MSMYNAFEGMSLKQMAQESKERTAIKNSIKSLSYRLLDANGQIDTENYNAYIVVSALQNAGGKGFGKKVFARVLTPQILAQLDKELPEALKTARAEAEAVKTKLEQANAKGDVVEIEAD